MSWSPNTLAASRRSWELRLCLAALLLLIIILFWLVARLLHEPEAPAASAQPIRDPGSLLGDHALAFLHPLPKPETDTGPFQFLRRFSKPQPYMPPNTTNTINQPNPQPPPPPPVPRRRLFYSGWLGPAGQENRTAFLEIADARTGAVLHRGPARIGQTLGGFTVLALEPKAATLRDSSGREHRVPLRQPLTIELP